MAGLPTNWLTGKFCGEGLEKQGFRVRKPIIRSIGTFNHASGVQLPNAYLLATNAQWVP